MIKSRKRISNAVALRGNDRAFANGIASSQKKLNTCCAPSVFSPALMDDERRGSPNFGKRGPKHRMKMLAATVHSGDLGDSYNRYAFTPPAAGSCPGALPAMRPA